MRKLERWMAQRGLSIHAFAPVVGISHQCLHKGIARGTFSRKTIAKLVEITGLAWEDFLLPNERTERHEARRRWRDLERKLLRGGMFGP